jgi:plasmid stabilization system protein ParE
MTRIVLSEATRSDRRAITAYSVEHFGVEQTRQLRDKFEAVLTLLAASPQLGRTNPSLDPPGKSFRYFPIMKTFVVVYEPTDKGIRVARILHGTRLLAGELEIESGS